MRENVSVLSMVKLWLQMSRIPFHTVGVCPFVLGTVLAWRNYGLFDAPLFIFSVLAVVLIMLNTYYTGEYCDVVEDRLSGTMEKNAFSGGTQVIAQNLLSSRHARVGSYVALVLTIVIGLIIQFYFETGPLTILLGVIGMCGGVFYSLMPIRWVARGVGEIIIGFCYGWLPVAVSCYLQGGRIDPLVHFLALPIACTIFNVILVNEFPDYPADVIARKTNLVVRYGKDVSAKIYIAVTILGWAGFGLSILAGVPVTALLFYAPFFLLSLVLSVTMGRKQYAKGTVLEIMCALTIVVNLGMTLSYIMSFLGKGVL